MLPADFRGLVYRSTTWHPEEAGVPASVMGEAHRLAASIAQTPGRREAVARHLAALGACRVGSMVCVARAALFQTPGLLLVDPRTEALYWSLDPGLADPLEAACTDRLVPLFGIDRERAVDLDAEPAGQS